VRSFLSNRQLTLSYRSMPREVMVLSILEPPHTVDTVPVARSTRRTAWLAESATYRTAAFVTLSRAQEMAKGCLKRTAHPTPFA
jgi:hypothetical protein